MARNFVGPAGHIYCLNWSVAYCYVTFVQLVDGAWSMPAASPAGSSQHSYSMAGDQLLLSRTNLYIRGLRPETTDKDLVTLCQQ
jgi:hypothetical protein